MLQAIDYAEQICVKCIGEPIGQAEELKKSVQKTTKLLTNNAACREPRCAQKQSCLKGIVQREIPSTSHPTVHATEVAHLARSRSSS